MDNRKLYDYVIVKIGTPSLESSCFFFSVRCLLIRSIENIKALEWPIHFPWTCAALSAGTPLVV